MFEHLQETLEPHSNTFTKALRALVFGGILSLISGDTLHRVQQTIEGVPVTRANECLHQFPKASEIPGVERFEFYENPGAKYCLVVIAQLHADTEGQMTEDVRISQYNILKILRFFKNDLRFKISRVYKEGLSEVDTQEKIEERSEEVLERKSEIDASLYLSREILQEMIDERELLKADPKVEAEGIESLDRQITSLKHLLERQEYEGWNGFHAVDILVALGEIKLLPAENEIAHQAAIGILYNSGGIFSPQDSRVLNYDREMALFNILSLRGVSPVFTVYGENHDFGDGEALNNWNKAHPDKAFSVLKIITQSKRGF